MVLDLKYFGPDQAQVIFNNINPQIADDYFHKAILEETSAVYFSDQCMQQENTTTLDNLAINGDQLRIEEEKGKRKLNFFVRKPRRACNWSRER